MHPFYFRPTAACLAGSSSSWLFGCRRRVSVWAPGHSHRTTLPLAGPPPPHTRVMTRAMPMTTPTTFTPLRILLFSASFNGMTAHIQRVLSALGHKTRFAPAVSTHAMLSAYENGGGGEPPDLIVCPTLKARIPPEIYSATLSLVLHPGVVSDRGPHSLDWAILRGVTEWGLTLLEAAEEMDGGRVWAAGRFPMPHPALHRTKAQLYNDPLVVSLASSLVLEAVGKVADLINVTDFQTKQSTSAFASAFKAAAEVVPLLEPHRTILASDLERVVDWNTDTTDVVLRKMRAADSAPGLKATLGVGEHTLTRFLYNGSPAHATATATATGRLNLPPTVKPGYVYGREAGGGGIYVATLDGGVRVGQLRSARSSGNRRDTFKTPSTTHLDTILLHTQIPELQSLAPDDVDGVEGVRVSEDAQLSFEVLGSGSGVGRIGILRYSFYNGALSTADCLRLRKAYESAATLHPHLDALLIVGAANGINLNVCEHAQNPEREAFTNLLAINTVVKAIIRSTHLLTVSVLESSAGAGGYWLAAASDLVFGVPGIVLNPHYIRMGLYGSELHTYTGMRRLGSSGALQLLKDTAPSFTVADASRLGLLDNIVLEPSMKTKGLEPGRDRDEFIKGVQEFVGELVEDRSRLAAFLARKQEIRAAHEATQPLDDYERLELLEMEQCIFGNRLGFQEKRQAFVYKLSPPESAQTEADAEIADHDHQQMFEHIWLEVQRKRQEEIVENGAESVGVGEQNQSLSINHKHSLLF